jgi:RNA 3'-terminal phosphate cyclase (ATP)
VRARVTPVDKGCGLQPLVLVDRGEPASVTGRAFVAGKVPRSVAEQMAKAAERAVRKALGDAVPLAIEVVVEDHRSAPVGDGAGIVLVCATSGGCVLGGSALGQRGVPAAKVGEAAAAELLSGLATGGCVDEHLADQLIVFMALAAGRSIVRAGPLSLHTRTAIAIAEQHTGATFTVTEDTKETVLITCDGIGHTRAC